jgi:hypothetical protein
MARSSTSGQGRPKGIPNQTTQAAKDAIAWAAEKLGGAKRLAAWAKEEPNNERIFWGTIYPKLLPLQLTGKDGQPIVIQLSKIDEGLL